MSGNIFKRLQKGCRLIIYPVEEFVKLKSELKREDAYRAFHYIVFPVSISTSVLTGIRLKDKIQQFESILESI
ncbi:hypothetical protein PTKIN_Ptkin09bG0010900 [Pterospermum kingtungense]